MRYDYVMTTTNRYAPTFANDDDYARYVDNALAFERAHAITRSRTIEFTDFIAINPRATFNDYFRFVTE